MIIAGVVGEDQRRTKLTIDRDDGAARLWRVAQLSVGNVGPQKLSSQQTRGSSHFCSAHPGQVAYRSRWLSFVSLAQYADADRCTVLASAGERAGAEQLGIVGVSDNGENSLAGKIKAHRSQRSWMSGSSAT